MPAKTNQTADTAPNEPNAGVIVETPAVSEHDLAVALLSEARTAVQAALDAHAPLPGSTIVGGCRGYLGGIMLEIDSRSRDIARMKQEQFNGA